MKKFKLLNNIALFTFLVVTLLNVGSCSKSAPSTGVISTTPSKSQSKAVVSITFNQFTPAITAVSDYGSGIVWRVTTFPTGTDLTKVIPTFVVSDKATTTPASGTPWDVSQYTTFGVTAEDGSIAVYYFSTQPNLQNAPPVK